MLYPWTGPTTPSKRRLDPVHINCGPENAVHKAPPEVAVFVPLKLPGDGTSFVFKGNTVGKGEIMCQEVCKDE